MADQPTYQELVDRLTALEARSITLQDLPLAPLQRKLELDWQPNASVLLGPSSITPEMLVTPFPAFQSATGSPTGSVKTAAVGTFATWIAGPSLSIAKAATYLVEAGPILVQQQGTVVTEARFMIAVNGVTGGFAADHVSANQFEASSPTARYLGVLAAGDVVTLAYSTNNQLVSFGALGALLTAKQVG